MVATPVFFGLWIPQLCPPSNSYTCYAHVRHISNFRSIFHPSISHSFHQASPLCSIVPQDIEFSLCKLWLTWTLYRKWNSPNIIHNSIVWAFFSIHPNFFSHLFLPRASFVLWPYQTHRIQKPPTPYNPQKTCHWKEKKGKRIHCENWLTKIRHLCFTCPGAHLSYPTKSSPHANSLLRKSGTHKKVKIFLRFTNILPYGELFPLPTEVWVGLPNTLNHMNFNKYTISDCSE